MIVFLFFARRRREGKTSKKCNSFSSVRLEINNLFKCLFCFEIIFKITKIFWKKVFPFLSSVV